MAWPKLDQVGCHGFPRQLLPLIVKAIDDEQVEWGRVGMFAEYCGAEFCWMSCNWKLNEYNEVVQDISLIKGKLDHPDLTAAMLRG